MKYMARTVHFGTIGTSTAKVRQAIHANGLFSTILLFMSAVAVLKIISDAIVAVAPQ